MVDDLERARQRRQRRASTKPAGAFGPSSRKKAVIDKVMRRVDAAAEQGDPAGYFAGKVPTPERITAALDLCALYGPEVDRILGGEEPMVDEWESGVRVPTFTQVQRLAALTLYPIRFFYMPPSPPVAGGFMCGSGGCDELGDRQ